LWSGKSRRSQARRDFLIPHDGIQKLIDEHLPCRIRQDLRRVPSLCPLVGSPYNFSGTSDCIERAIRSTWHGWRKTAWRNAGSPAGCDRAAT
jgi:hypothetical protein